MGAYPAPQISKGPYWFRTNGNLGQQYPTTPLVSHGSTGTAANGAFPNELAVPGTVPRLVRLVSMLITPPAGINAQSYSVTDGNGIPYSGLEFSYTSDTAGGKHTQPIELHGIIVDDGLGLLVVGAPTAVATLIYEPIAYVDVPPSQAI